MMKRGQENPSTENVSNERPVLKLYNSLSKQKEVFTPIDGNYVKWYSCGPTVYDASHMGHARTYISFDILRRVLTDYFGYNIFYVMNITDIDDKIIKRARQNYLYERYLEQPNTLHQLIDDHKATLDLLHSNIKTNTDPDKLVMLENLVQRIMEALASLKEAVESKDKTNLELARINFLKECKDPLSEWLDQKYGSTIVDNTIFEALPKYWENEFHIDMKLLNILEPDVLTRVSEYVPQIIKYIEQIIENGYAYESNGSVYFNVQKFNDNPNHSYAKLVPEAYGNTIKLNEGEGDLITDEQKNEKKSPNDFALWKLSKLGEPKWLSKWGNGRPGWHIECSTMASDICGSVLDIHTGGIDLKFPHHDNELAQSEAYYNHNQWIKYFLHTGHLTISGCKMSKSLKNFVTIKQALEKNTATQLRLAFLMHSWKDTLDYSNNTMEMAIQYEKFLNEFFLNVKDIIRKKPNDSPSKQFNEWTKIEAEIEEKFKKSKDLVHEALCDNINTRSVLDNLRDLVTITNIYIKDNHHDKLNCLLLKRIALYITDILYIFGTINGPRGLIGFPIGNSIETNLEENLMPYLSTMADFRSSVRKNAREIKATDILLLCDKLRDDVLPNLGVRLEDNETTGQTVVKLVDKNILMKERETKKQLEAEKQAEKEKRKLQAEAAQAIKDEQKKINPIDMFRNETDKYSAFDENGLPTFDLAGKEISKGQQKKLQKLQQAQEKKYNEYIASIKENV